MHISEPSTELGVEKMWADLPLRVAMSFPLLISHSCV